MLIAIGVVAFVFITVYACLVLSARKDEEAEYTYMKFIQEKNKEEEDSK